MRLLTVAQASGRAHLMKGLRFAVLAFTFLIAFSAVGSVAAAPGSTSAPVLMRAAASADACLDAEETAFLKLIND